MKSVYKNKKLAILLSSTLLFNSLSPTTKAFEAKNVANSIIKNNGARKLLKGVGILSALGAAGTLGYYALGKILDLIDPSRIVSRENSKKALEEIKLVDKKINKILNDPKNEVLSDENNTKIEKLLKQKQALNDIVNNNKSTLNTLKNISGVGGAIACGYTALNLVDGVGDISKKVLNISCLKYAARNLMEIGSKVKGQFEVPAEEFSKEKVFDRFNKGFQDVKGQDKALGILKDYIYDIVVGKDQAKWSNKKYAHGDVIYLYGPSGVGKSLVADRLPSLLYSNPKVFTINASDVDKDKKDSVISQIFNPGSNAPVNPYGPPVEKPENIIDFLKKNPNGIIKIEEYDKISTPALDELLCTIINSGIINIDGTKIDCSGALFILTSNEDNLSMEGFSKDDKDSKKLDNESYSKGLTRVWHSKHFLNRIKKVEFDNLDVSACSKIIRDHINKIFAYWSDPKNAGIKLIIDDNIIESLAKKVCEMKQGARPIDIKILPALQSQIGSKIKSAASLDFYNGKTFNVLYNENQNTFDLKII